MRSLELLTSTQRKTRLDDLGADPLHAQFLYSPEDDQINRYIKDHWSSLDRMSGNCCDIHPSLAQFEGKEDVYDFVDKWDVRLSESAGILFWALQDDFCFVSLKKLDEDQLVNAIRIIFEEIRKAPQ